MIGCALCLGLVWGWTLGLTVPAGGSRPQAPLPDTVLVRIEHERDITWTETLDRWTTGRRSASVDSITPKAVREFLDVLVDEAVLTAAAVREGHPWSAADSAAHRALEDRLELAAALDREFREARAAGVDSIAGAEALGLAARDRAMARLAPTFDEAALARVARAFAALPRLTADSSLAAQIRMLEKRPSLTRGDSLAVLARSPVGDVHGGDVVEAWARLSVAYRPRVETAEQVRDLAKNQLFERALRASVARGDFDRDPAVLAGLETHSRQLAVRAYLDRRVFDGLEVDTVAARRDWERHSAEWALPTRVRGVGVTLDDRIGAARMGVTLSDAAAAESLAARARRGGLDYGFTLDASDSVLFHAAMAAGPGAVAGPISVTNGWWVGRVDAVVPGRTRRYDEVRAQVADRWLAQAAERRTRALAETERASHRIIRNARAEAAMVDTLRARARAEAAPAELQSHR